MMNDIICPECKRNDFKTDGGMKIHYYHKHGGSIAKKESECRLCGKKFDYYPSEKPGKYCSSCVDTDEYYEIFKDNLGYYAEGEEHPVYDRIPVKCDYCGKEDKITPSEERGKDYHFCNRKCYGRWRSKNMTGSSNPNYIDGQSRQYLYSKNWSSNRKEVLERDSYSCTDCGKSKEEIGRNPDVHHIIPVREFEDIEKAHSIDNLKCLCPECHRKAERK